VQSLLGLIQLIPAPLIPSLFIKSQLLSFLLTLSLIAMSHISESAQSIAWVL
jgi:hypothetical protein